MPAIDSIIQVNVTPSTTAVATESFAIPLILGPTIPSNGLPTPPGPQGSSAVTQTMITCSSPADLLSSGYQATDPEYIYAQALCSQALRPAVFKVCQRTGANSVGNDLVTASALDDSWYAVVCPGLSDDEIVQAAAQIESMTKIFVAVSSTAAIAQTVNTDIASTLQSQSHTRTALMFTSNASSGIEAAWVGGQLPKAPGSSTWAYKTLVGISPDNLNPGQAQALIGTPVLGQVGKAVNCYQLVGGVPVTMEGTVCNGGFIDLRIGIDSLRSLIKTNVYQALVSNDKIPYTDAGAAIIEQAIRGAIQTHIDYGFVAADSPTTPITVSHTPVAQVSATQRAQRLGPPFQFACNASGAQQAVAITGSVNI